MSLKEEIDVKLSELLRKKFASPEASDLVPLDTEEARHCAYNLDQMHQWRKLYRIVEPSLKLSERIQERRILLAELDEQERVKNLFAANPGDPSWKNLVMQVPPKHSKTVGFSMAYARSKK